MTSRLDAVVVGAGPNGLAAAVVLAEKGLDVRVLEGAHEVGGGARTESLTLPGFLHDTCSAVHPMGASSPLFRSLTLEDHGLEWIHPPAPLAHPLDGGRAVLLEREPEETARSIVTTVGAAPSGRPMKGSRWPDLVEPFAARFDELAEEILRPIHLPSHPVLLARFGLRALRSAVGLASARLEHDEARALFAGIAAHSALPLDRSASAAVGLVLAAAGHGVGWPIPRGGAAAVANALRSRLESAGGEVETGRWIGSLDELPPSRAVVLDVTPRQLLSMAGDGLPDGYRRALARYRYGPAAFKVDWALDGPIPWAAPACGRAGTIHLGGAMDEIAGAEAAPWRGAIAEQPFVILAQPSLFDDTRAPPGKHTAWAYSHVPNGWSGDAAERERVTARIEAQVERFAPGFRDRILARSVLDPSDLEERNPNLVGGDIGGGVQDLGQLFFRPVAALRPYRTPVDGLYLCSSSTPPGGGVHGMCGYHAARTVLSDLFPGHVGRGAR